MTLLASLNLQPFNKQFPEYFRVYANDVTIMLLAISLVGFICQLILGGKIVKEEVMIV